MRAMRRGGGASRNWPVFRLGWFGAGTLKQRRIRMDIAVGLGMALLVILALLAGWVLGSRAARATVAPRLEVLRESKEEVERLRREREPLLVDRAAFQQQAEELRRQSDEQR